MILGYPEYEPQAMRLAEQMDVPFGRVAIHRFPDGEHRITLPPELPPRVVLCRSLNQPNEKLVDLLLAAETARELGATHLTLVAPYLCYMRQDTAFQPGEAVSQRIIGRLLAGLFDAVVTVDPHLHRVTRLAEAIPARHAIALCAAPAMAGFLRRWADTRRVCPLLLGPDVESQQWVSAIADEAELEYAVATKRRFDDHHVEITLPPRDYRGRDVVLVDDIASTGNTLIAVAHQLKAAGAGPIRCLVTHALFTAQAQSALRAAGIETIWSSDSITHESNAVPLAPWLAQALHPH